MESSLSTGAPTQPPPPPPQELGPGASRCRGQGFVTLGGTARSACGAPRRRVGDRGVPNVVWLDWCWSDQTHWAGGVVGADSGAHPPPPPPPHPSAQSGVGAGMHWKESGPGGRLEEVGKTVPSGYCRLRVPLAEPGPRAGPKGGGAPPSAAFLRPGVAAALMTRPSPPA